MFSKWIANFVAPPAEVVVTAPPEMKGLLLMNEPVTEATLSRSPTLTRSNGSRRHGQRSGTADGNTR